MYNVDDAKLQGNHKHGLVNALTMVWTPSPRHSNIMILDHIQCMPIIQNGYRGGLRLAWKVDPSPFIIKIFVYILWIKTFIRIHIHEPSFNYFLINTKLPYIRMRRGFAHVEFGRVVGEVALGD